MITFAYDAGTFLLLFARVGSILMLLPVFSEEAVPMRIRLLIALSITFGLSVFLSDRFALVPVVDNLLGPLVAEITLGLALGMLVRIMFFAAAMAGSIISLQMGLSAAMVFDAGQGGQVPLLSKFVVVAAACVCLAMNVHHLWLRSIVESYAAFPVGALPPARDLAELATTAMSRALELGLGLAAPFLVFGVVFNAVLGLANRLAPTIQVFFIGQPLNILAGMALLAATLGLILSTFAEAMIDWQRTLWG